MTTMPPGGRPVTAAGTSGMLPNDAAVAGVSAPPTPSSGTSTSTVVGQLMGTVTVTGGGPPPLTVDPGVSGAGTFSAGPTLLASVSPVAVPGGRPLDGDGSSSEQAGPPLALPPSALSLPLERPPTLPSGLSSAAHSPTVLGSDHVSSGTSAVATPVAEPPMSPEFGRQVSLSGVPRIAFMVASPLVSPPVNGTMATLQPLNFYRERRNIWESLHSASRRIALDTHFATSGTVARMTVQRPYLVYTHTHTHMHSSQTYLQACICRCGCWPDGLHGV